MSFIRSRIRSFGYAFKGIGTLFRTQVHARIHAVAIAAIAVQGLWVGLEAWEWCALVGCMALVISLEAVNTAVELLADKISPAHDELVGKAKDVAAGAVLLAVVLSGVVWALVFWG